MCSLSPFSSFFSHINPPAFAGGLRGSSIELCAVGDAVIRHQQMQLFLAVCKVGLLLRSGAAEAASVGLSVLLSMSGGFMAGWYSPPFPRYAA